MIVVKLRGARNRAKARDGKCEGAKAFGEVDAAELAVVDRIKSMRSTGETLRAIADVLNSEGIPARRGGKWYPMTIANILRQAAIINPPRSVSRPASRIEVRT
jgi:hypothetical protein